MISTPSAVSASISCWTSAATSWSTSTSPGLEIVASAVVVAPTSPTRRPPTSTTVDRPSASVWASAASAGSPSNRRLAETKGGAGSSSTAPSPSNARTKSANTSGPKSNSWFPIAEAS